MDVFQAINCVLAWEASRGQRMYSHLFCHTIEGPGNIILGYETEGSVYVACVGINQDTGKPMVLWCNPG